MLAKVLSIQGDLSDNHIREVSKKVQVPPFEPIKAKNKIKKEDEKDIYKKEQEKEEAELSTIIKELSIYDKKNIDPNKLKPRDLEIDDDTSGHIDFIHISANLRAKNYNIKECDKFKTKMMVGNIIPTIVTTASTITGLASLQLYTLYQTNKINFMRDCYLNLGINSIIMSEPKSVIRKKDKENDPILLGPVKAIPPG
jgi:ubiquitin-activating enzyme E1